MQRLAIWAALVVISLVSATPADAFHHGRRGCYGYGCGYGGCGYGGCGYGGYGYGGYGGGYYGGYGGYPMYGYYGGYPMYATMTPSPYSGVAYAAARTPAANGFVGQPSYYVAPGYSVACRLWRRSIPPQRPQLRRKTPLAPCCRSRPESPSQPRQLQPLPRQPAPRRPCSAGRKFRRMGFAHHGTRTPSSHWGEGGGRRHYTSSAKIVCRCASTHRPSSSRITCRVDAPAGIRRRPDLPLGFPPVLRRPNRARHPQSKSSDARRPVSLAQQP